MITLPDFVEGNSLLRDNVAVVVSICREDAVYQFDSQVKRQEATGKRLAILTPPKNIRRVQRRRFFRIELFRKLSYAPVNAAMGRDDYEDDVNWQGSNTLNVSGGGFLMKVEEGVKKGDLLLLKIDFFNELGLPEIIVGVCRRTVRSEGRTLAGVELLLSGRLAQFLKPEQLRRLPHSIMRFNRREQDRLVNYIFIKQIEMRNRGLL
jgi:c-di-GMP-binding flagellar brake protein YcgR